MDHEDPSFSCTAHRHWRVDRRGRVRRGHHDLGRRAPGTAVVHLDDGGEQRRPDAGRAAGTNLQQLQPAVGERERAGGHPGAQQGWAAARTAHPRHLHPRHGRGRTVPSSGSSIERPLFPNRTTWRPCSSRPRPSRASTCCRDTIATRGNHQPVWAYTVGEESRAGTTGIYTNPFGDLITGASKLGAVPDFTFFASPASTRRRCSTCSPGRPRSPTQNTIVFKGNYTVGGAGKTGVFYRESGQSSRSPWRAIRWLLPVALLRWC